MKNGMDDRAAGRVGLIAGSGRLSLLWAAEVAAVEPDGYGAITAVAVTDEAYDNLRELVNVTRVPLGRFNRTAKALREGGAKTLSFVGKVEKVNMLKGLKLDLKTVRLVAALPDYNDATIMDSITREFEKEGFEVLPQTAYLGKYLVEEAVYTKRRPSKDDREEISFAMLRAYAVADLGIGQTVVVRRKGVLAVEAIEGTDEAIRRAADYSDGKGGTVAKAMKKGQDLRYDVPTVGLKTIKAVIDGGFKNLALEAGSAFLVERDEVIGAADGAGVCLIGVPREVG
ncbi:MAG: UDP-2,3-diacylglucosamine diphosphatase LpxI [Candidatus Coatesbacteria bacterium]|nr:MAG: UDP-2,3-diacylglucosamine diphosphatase LpxI [Candidatus Coatesbacteria bacterium]